MENSKDWQYNTSLTVRLDRKLKNRITREAESRGMSVSEYFRTFYESAALPDAFLSILPEKHRAFLEKYIAREEAKTGKSRYEIVSSLVLSFVLRGLDTGFFIDFKRSL